MPWPWLHINFDHQTYVIVSTSGSLGRGSVGDAVARAGVEAEELGTHSLVLEAGAGPAVLAALGVQGEQLAGQHPGQRLLLVRRVVHTRGRLPAETRNIRIIKLGVNHIILVVYRVSQKEMLVRKVII